ncbi:hypothetical protein FHS29_001389 [Saccharothrix tamanrassetensis]|uniref:Uncharacterized protein n=1 Tax=Saccharothrix tamanrassetensis TaxID=1051531 RepID=A0A841CBN6_9PSEU|nr:hypothetical protein [Saccharothrix tamanrassetensis]MBB5954819.1 hypothetical protein [Saccharothrix tamanrassetensis]
MTEEPPRNPPPPDIDPEQLRQFQEFQRFQEYQRFQQAQGTPALPPGTSPPPPTTPHPTTPHPTTPPPAAPAKPPRKPVWKVLLGSKLFRRLVYLVVVLLLLGYFYDKYFGGPTPGDVAVDSGGDKGNVIAPQTPYGLQGTVALFYKHVINDDAGRACLLFSEDQAKKNFTEAFRAKDCESAVHQLSGQVTNSAQYRQLGFPADMRAVPNGGSVEVSSCELQVTGGPRLGRFVLSMQDNKTWVITGYQAEPADCLTG